MFAATWVRSHIILCRIYSPLTVKIIAVSNQGRSEVKVLPRYGILVQYTHLSTGQVASGSVQKQINKHAPNLGMLKRTLISFGLGTLKSGARFARLRLSLLLSSSSSLLLGFCFTFLTHTLYPHPV